MIRIILILGIILSSCKSTEKCDAYVEEYDIYKHHIDNQKKYCSTEIIK